MNLLVAMGMSKCAPDPRALPQRVEAWQIGSSMGLTRMQPNHMPISAIYISAGNLKVVEGSIAGGADASEPDHMGQRQP